jgi:hypothetical protein
VGGFWFLASLYCDLYLPSFDRSVFRGLPLLSVLSLPLHWTLWLFHGLESIFCRLTGKNVENQRAGWAVNYVYVARTTRR